ncbi:gliding motility-associated C-terminal domain-containing protein [Galbibacter mesophilus]|uniref:gliding motility-associated C-terminal domain-containing protein n=2 Tax=Galbibacter mesophilus TaxID=379069 RepID=UPI00191CDB93|nr:gliding motility-associated C-terminal domain-containing protein [Galbibacter mesophilus]
MAVMPNTQMVVFEDFYNQNAGELYNDGELHFKSSFTNDAVFDYLDGGLTAFNGAGVQRITGANESYFYDILFSNNSGLLSSGNNASFELEGLISIANLATFDAGIVNNDDFGGTISFEENASHENASDNSFVDGFVSKAPSGFFRYPIGDDSFYRQLDVTPSNSTSAAISTKYTLRNSDDVYSHDDRDPGIDFIDDQEYWEITGLSGDEALITIFWRDETTSTTILNEIPESLTIVYYDSQIQTWVDLIGLPGSEPNSLTATASSDGLYALAITAFDPAPPPAPECGNITIHNAISPNNDGMNDFFKVERENEEDCDYTNPISVKIFNRWGILVFESDNYGTDIGGDVFKGYSEGRATLNKNELLPTGTYYYIMQFSYEGDGETQVYNESGYLYLTSD